MTSINFAEGNENSVLSFLACAALCVGALAISLELGIAMAVILAAGAIFNKFTGPNSGMSAKP